MSQSSAPKSQSSKTLRFAEADEHSVIDLKKRLIWLKQDTRQLTGKWLSWVQARDYAKELNSASYGGFRTWRMPSVEEARTLFDKTQSNKDHMGQKALIPEVFPEGFGFLCWTKDVRNKVQAIRFSFRKGSIMYDDIYRVSRGATRFVREIEK